MTGRVEGLNKKAPESYIEIHPETANKHKIEDGEIIRVISRRGAIFTKARVVDIVNKNIVFMPFHYAEGAANVLTNNTLDENCKIPELKVCAVKIEKIEI
jgi:formate dehydrogenase major subunit